MGEDSSPARKVQEDDEDPIGEDEAAPLVASPPRSASLQQRPAEQLSVRAEIWDLTQLAFPIFISRISSTLKNVTDTAILGHIDTDSRFLLASALADMWMQSTGTMMNGRVLGVFCSQAFGAGNKPLAGIWLQVSLSVLAVIAVPVLVLWLATEAVMLWLGQPDFLSSDAGYYARVFALAIPARIIFGQVSQFLQVAPPWHPLPPPPLTHTHVRALGGTAHRPSGRRDPSWATQAQRIMRPSAQLSVQTSVLNLGLGVFLVLGFPMSGWAGYGFKACPWVTLGCEYLQVRPRTH